MHKLIFVIDLTITFKIYINNLQCNAVININITNKKEVTIRVIVHACEHIYILKGNVHVIW